MLRPLSLLLCACSVTCALCSDAQVPAKRLTSRTVDALAGEILEAGKSPGGIELISGCDTLEPTAFRPDAEGPDAALAEVASREKRMTWVKNGPAYTVTIQLAPVQSIALARLPALQIEAKTLTAATGELLQARAVRDRIAGMNLTELTQNFGFTSVNEGKARTVDLPAGTLREDLNAIAIAFGAAIWKLDQRECGNSRTFRISWIAK